MITALMLTVGIGGAVLKVGRVELKGIGLAALVGIFLNLILPDRD
jgi:uracil permease